MSFSREFPVLIVGAGTGGLALAHGLRRTKHTGAGLRAGPDPDGRTAGVPVGISPNGVRSLRDCLPPELFDTFVATTARDYAGYNMYTERFAPLISITSDYLLAPGRRDQGLFGEPDDAPPGTAHRPGRHRRIRQEVRPVRGRDHGDSVTAFFEDESSATGSGADRRGRGKLSNPEAVPARPPNRDRVDRDRGHRASPTTCATHCRAARVTRCRCSSTSTDSSASCTSSRCPGAATGELKDGIGGTDAELIRPVAGLLFDDNTTDYVSWGVSGIHTLLPADVLQADGTQLRKEVDAAGGDGRLASDPRDVGARLAKPTTTFALRVRIRESARTVAAEPRHAGSATRSTPSFTRGVAPARTPHCATRPSLRDTLIEAGTAGRACSPGR